ncbi:MAG: hypothetical protein HN849_23620, partial [Victivallales bacterium]|nr:hypothetical protein [Victivallales bacterium]
MNHSLILRFLMVATIAALAPATAQEKDDVGTASPLQVRATDFSNAYWLNGWKKAPKDTTPDILCIEAGRYGLKLDVNDLRNPRFGLLDDDTDYERSHAAGTRRLESLPPAKL